MRTKKVFRYSFLLVISAMAIAILSVNNVAAQAGGGPLGQILTRLDVHNKALKSVEANVTMVKMNTQLNLADTYTGTTKYLPKAKGKLYLRLDWAKPTVEYVSVIGDSYKLYKPSINQVYIGKVNKAKTSAGAGNALGFMNMSKDQLKANYSVVYLDEALVNGEKTWHLKLTPKNPSSYTAAELWVDGNGMPVQAKIFEQNSDTTMVTLSNIKKNVVIPGKLFELSVPRGAKEIKA